MVLIGVVEFCFHTGSAENKSPCQLVNISWVRKWIDFVWVMFNQNSAQEQTQPPNPTPLKQKKSSIVPDQASTNIRARGGWTLPPYLWYAKRAPRFRFWGWGAVHQVPWLYVLKLLKECATIIGFIDLWNWTKKSTARFWRVLAIMLTKEKRSWKHNHLFELFQFEP